jgi:hypothetical protein
VPRARFRELLPPHRKARQIALAGKVARAQPGRNRPRKRQPSGSWPDTASRVRGGHSPAHRFGGLFRCRHRDRPGQGVTSVS